MPDLTEIQTFATALRSHYEPAVIKTEAGEVSIRVRRLTKDEIASVLFQDKVQPPEIPGAPADAPLEARYNHNDPDYQRKRLEEFQRSVPETLNLAVKGGIPGDDEAARRAWLDANLASSVVTALYWHVVNLSGDRDLVKIVNFSSPAA